MLNVEPEWPTRTVFRSLTTANKDLTDLVWVVAFEQLLVDAVDSVCETVKMAENYSKTAQPENKINAELDDEDTSTFIEENLNKNTVKKTRAH